MMFGSLCGALLALVVMLGETAAAEIVLEVSNPAAASWFHPQALRFQDVAVEKYNIYDENFGMFVISAGKTETYSFEVSCKKIPNGHYVIVVNGELKTGTYVQDDNMETLTLNDVSMATGSYAIVGYSPEGVQYTAPTGADADNCVFTVRRAT